MLSTETTLPHDLIEVKDLEFSCKNLPKWYMIPLLMAVDRADTFVSYFLSQKKFLHVC